MSFQLKMGMSMGTIKVRDLWIKRTGQTVPYGMWIDPMSPDEGEDNHDDELSDCLGEAQAWHQMNLVEIEQNEISNEEWISSKKLTVLGLQRKNSFPYSPDSDMGKSIKDGPNNGGS